MNLYEKDLFDLNNLISKKKEELSLLVNDRDNKKSERANLKSELYQLNNAEIKKTNDKADYLWIVNQIRKFKTEKWLITLLVILINFIALGYFAFDFVSIKFIFLMFLSSILGEIIDILFTNRDIKAYKKEIADLSLVDFNLEISALKNKKSVIKQYIKETDQEIEKLDSDINEIILQLDKLEQKYSILVSYYENEKQNIIENNEDLQNDAVVNNNHAKNLNKILTIIK